MESNKNKGARKEIYLQDRRHLSCYYLPLRATTRMIATIFWIVLATWSRAMHTPTLQEIVDKNQGIYVNDLGSQTGCNWIRYVAAHSFNDLWKKIAAIKIGDKITFDGCNYIARTSEIVEISGYDTRQLQKRNGTLWTQTCANDGRTFSYLIERRAVKKKVLTPKFTKQNTK